MNSCEKKEADVLVKEPIQSFEIAAYSAATFAPAVRRSMDVAIEGLALDRSRRGSLVSQIVEQITTAVTAEESPAMDRMPSVRGLARALGVSSFTVVEAYDRLVAGGHLVSRRGAGYFVAPHRSARAATALAVEAGSDPPTASPPPALEHFPAATNRATLPVGGPCLPDDWHDSKWLQECGRTALRSGGLIQQGNGHAFGLVDLRRQIARRLQATGIDVDEDRVVLARGATHGIDLVLRALTQPGDSVLVEDPSFSGVLPLVRHHGCIALPVSRTASGLDLEALAALAKAHRPKLAIVTTVLHDPLGVTLNSLQAHRLLALAEQFDFWLVEDDVFRELANPGDPSLAAMDGLNRVIRVDSTSRVLPSIARVGSIAAAPRVVAEIARLKTVTGLHACEFGEKLALHALSSSEFRRHVSRIKARLERARETTLRILADLGLEPLAIPQGGPFVSARLAATHLAGSEVTRYALEHGVGLSSSLTFSGTDGDAPWFRFNVAHSEHPALRQIFIALATGHEKVDAARDHPRNSGRKEA
jgi:DNA-binding transcriptional MocR family regulator